MSGYANPQNLNRYSYVTNNPLRYTDPTGHMQCEDYQGSCVSEKQVTKIYEAKQEKNKKKSDDKNDPLKKFFRDKNTPLQLALYQEYAAGIADAGLVLAVGGSAAFPEAAPVLAPIGAAIHQAGWAVGRVLGAVGVAVTAYQYKNNLNGTNGTDVVVSLGTEIAGFYQPAQLLASSINLIYTGYRTDGGQIPNFPSPFS